MCGPNYNEMTVEELMRLHEEEQYRYMINDGRILWVYQD